jgi:hypothetical protein
MPRRWNLGGDLENWRDSSDQYGDTSQVTGCEQDAYGFLVSISVNQSQYENWFPQSYCPQYLRFDDDQEVYLSQSTLW